jgi:hypothetical protein
MPGQLRGLSAMFFYYEIVVHPLVFKASELLFWVVYSCTVSTEAFGASTVAQKSNTWYLSKVALQLSTHKSI